MRSTFSQLSEEHSARLLQLLTQYTELVSYIAKLPLEVSEKDYVIRELTRILESVNSNNKLLLDNLKSSFEDLSLNVNYMAFDLIATKKEKEALEHRLKDLEN